MSENVISPTIVDRVKEALHKEKSWNNQHLSKPHCSRRLMRQPNRYLGVGESHGLTVENLKTDPNTYQEAINYVNRDLWKKGNRI